MELSKYFLKSVWSCNLFTNTWKLAFKTEQNIVIWYETYSI